MKFILQNEIGVTEMETRAIRHAAMLNDYQISLATLKTIGDVISDATPVGTVEFVKSFAKANDIVIPKMETYPVDLYPFYRRSIAKTRFEDVLSGWFCKPIDDVKKFTGDIVENIVDAIDNDCPVFMSEPVKFVSESRYYILDGKILGYGRYDDNDNDVECDIKIVENAIISMQNPPIGYSLDFGVLENGDTALVEMNDAWALGYYKGTCSSNDYTKLLDARWQEIKSATSLVKV